MHKKCHCKCNNNKKAGQGAKKNRKKTCLKRTSQKTKFKPIYNGQEGMSNTQASCYESNRTIILKT